MPTRSRLPSLWLGLTLALCLVAVGADAYAARGATSSAAAASLVKSVSVVGPLGISPFFALAGFGIAASLGVWSPPPGLEAFAHPAVWLAMLAFAALLQFGRSTKLTKPVAELLGTGESLFGVIAVIMVLLPQMAPSTPVAAAGVGTGLGVLLLIAGLSAVVALVIVRTALDVVIWLSPFPFVDAFFQLLKLAATVGLVTLAIIFPPAAIVVNALVVVAALVFARWAVRNAQFGASVVYDLSLGRMGTPIEMPRDPAVETDLGPFEGFVLDVPGYAKRSAVRVEMDAGRWFLKTDRLLGEEKKTALGDDHELELAAGFMGLELTSPAGRVLLRPRYKHLAPRMLQETRLKQSDKPALGMRQPRRAQRAQASVM